MSEVDLVFIKLKLNCESEGVVVPREPHIFLFVVVLEIGDVCSYTMPASVKFLFCSCREGQDSHSIIIERVTF